ncbi:MAG: acetyl-CoA decarbonylase/synthase complex subunit delta [Thermoanaerobacteraceae bacterium]|uniref:CO dehydrogenase/acetyl-CoA synthase subunit delta n=1 Tax=Thermanaeromonas sp. C210 TaxID=2731925 RepID=UPI00155D509D|nr:CO dehydrogenase/acetyl-CoA synthase subunit delta [Thermanaeromonas sp. C210]MBE3582198.1 acetyl-CoA decarbonylase/synthase complex subunit delta [Thermoanaerobacteraceae bacterium]GFN23604.1 corrinoid/iron-sulfur protein small subunit [Thermanaeromonas sp. C210]
MPVQILKEKSRAAVQTVTLGATPEQGGTRSHTVTIGGDAALPFHHFEGEIPHRPVVAMEVQDIEPEWPEPLKRCFAGVMKEPGRWAEKCVREYGADLIYVKLDGADPEGANRTAEQCVNTVKEVLQAVGVPLIVVGCGDAEKDKEVLEAVAEAAAGENLLLGNAEQNNYQSLTAACMVHKHNIIARSPLDINICKQLNILISEMNLPLNRIVIDPSIGSLGYGIEYAYSIMERTRLGALQGDKMLSMPVLCTVGYEAWRAKEASAPVSSFPGWGDVEERGILWEAVTAAAVLQAGAHILLMRHPQAVALVKENIDRLMVNNAY